MSSRGLVHTKLSDVSTEQQIIAEWSDSCNNKNKSMNMYFAKNVTKLSDVSTEQPSAKESDIYDSNIIFKTMKII